MVESMTTICSSNRYFRGGDIGFFMVIYYEYKSGLSAYIFFLHKKACKDKFLTGFRYISLQ